MMAAGPLLASGEINLYSARNEALIKPLLDRFTEQTGISVNLVTGKADTLLKRLESEGDNSPADMLITTDAGRLHRAKQAGLTQAVETQVLNDAVPAPYREPEGHWYGLSLRARPIFYAKDRVSPESLSSYRALAGPEWAGKICIRSSDNIYNQSLVAAMIAHDGEEKTQEWVNGLVENFARSPKGGDRDQIKAVAAGECDIALANTYYLAGMLTGNDQNQRLAAQAVAVYWPDQEGRGTHVNVSGAAVTAFARNRENAIKLLEFLVSPESQSWYGEVNQEYPVRDGVAWSQLLNQWGRFKADQLNLSLLGENNAQAVMIMDRAGWK
ncbi:MAG: Fe(3+) ABC transporter substrate-binding protein [Gammaproteobacteria bacterium]|nr:Fe(3+) ABC transporter substrate-binding protein [Gammaproteobacteria bacterium]